MQILRDALKPERLDEMRKIFEGEKNGPSSEDRAKALSEKIRKADEADLEAAERAALERAKKELKEIAR
jgi:DNA-directed RNA polymerase subunit F